MQPGGGYEVKRTSCSFVRVLGVCLMAVVQWCVCAIEDQGPSLHNAMLQKCVMEDCTTLGEDMKSGGHPVPLYVCWVFA